MKLRFFSELRRQFSELPILINSTYIFGIKKVQRSYSQLFHHVGKLNGASSFCDEIGLQSQQ